MAFKDWFEAGFTDLIPITPAGASLSPRCSIKPEQTGKAPGQRNADGTWSGFDWRKIQTTEKHIARWASWAGVGVGLRTDRFPCVDIDVLDQELAELVEQITLKVLGPAPRRTGRAPKRALAYRTEAPFRVKKLWFGPEDETHKHCIEVLGDGQQYVVAGVHPFTRRPYHWDSFPPALGAEALGLIDQAKIEALFVELEKALAERGLATTREGSGKASLDRERIDQEQLLGNIESVEAAVALIPNDNKLFPKRLDYIRFGCAIKAACGAENKARGFDIFAAWADRWEGNDRFPGGNDPDTVLGDWARMKPPFSVGADFIFEMAQPFGFNAAGEDFDALEPDPGSEPQPQQSGPMPAAWGEGQAALRFAAEHGARAKHVHATGRWHLWDGKRWAIDETERALNLVMRVCWAMSEEYVLQNPKKQAHGRKTSSNAFITATAKEAARLRSIARTPTVWDADPWLLNTPAGVVDLKTGELVPHDPQLLCSKMTAVGPEAMPTPRWNTFLAEIMCGDLETVAYLQRVFGYGLTGSTREHAMWFGYGDGENGKGRLLYAITGALGDYAMDAPPETFTTSGYDRHPTELARLIGARLVVSTETEAARYWAEARIKMITGGDQITARFMHCNFFSFLPQFKLFITGNHKPQLKNVDTAIQRRFNLIPFLFRPKERNVHLDDELRAEWPGILQWMIDGCLAWQKDGLRPPKAVIEATAEYFTEEDDLGRWIAERCQAAGPKDFTSSQDLFDDWTIWRGENGVDALKNKIAFGRAMAKRFEKALHPETRLAGFNGIELRQQTEGAEFA